MAYQIAKVCQPVIGAFVVEYPNRQIKASDEHQADKIKDAINSAYLTGKKDAQREVRNALGLKDFGGDVTILRESK